MIIWTLPLLTQTPRFSQTLLLLFSAKHEAKPSEFLNLIYIKILLEDTSVTACQTPRNCFPTPRKKLCGVSAKIQISPLRSEMLAIIRDVISQWLLRISQCMNIWSKWVKWKVQPAKKFTQQSWHISNVHSIQIQQRKKYHDANTKIELNIWLL